MYVKVLHRLPRLLASSSRQGLQLHVDSRYLGGMYFVDSSKNYRTTSGGYTSTTSRVLDDDDGVCGAAPQVLNPRTHDAPCSFPRQCGLCHFSRVFRDEGR